MSRAWWDGPLTWLTSHSPSVLWHCWLGHVTRKIVSEMTYNVSSGTLNSTIPLYLFTITASDNASSLVSHIEDCGDRCVMNTLQSCICGYWLYCVTVTLQQYTLAAVIFGCYVWTVMKIGSNLSGVYRFQMPQGHYAFVQTKSKLCRNESTAASEFVVSTHSVVRCAAVL